MDELKPCPFCGSINIKFITSMNHVFCKNCEAEINYSNYNTALCAKIAWNKRVEPKFKCTPLKDGTNFIEEVNNGE